MKDEIIDYGSNAAGHWKKFKSGRIEQWGFMAVNGQDPRVLTFPVPFVSGVHSLKTMATRDLTYNATEYHPINGTVSLASVTVRGAGVSWSGSAIVGFYWKAKGV